MNALVVGRFRKRETEVEKISQAREKKSKRAKECLTWIASAQQSGTILRQCRPAYSTGVAELRLFPFLQLEKTNEARLVLARAIEGECPCKKQNEKGKKKLAKKVRVLRSMRSQSHSHLFPSYLRMRIRGCQTRC